MQMSKQNLMFLDMNENPRNGKSQYACRRLAAYPNLSKLGLQANSIIGGGPQIRVKVSSEGANK